MKRTSPRLARWIVPALAISAPLPSAAQIAGGGDSLPHAARPLSHALDYRLSSGALIPPTWDGGSTEIELADVDGDGHPDLVSIGDHGSPSIGTDQHGIMVWRGDGQGAFSLVMTGNFGYGGIAVGDVDGDGKADVGYGMHHDYATGDLGDQLIEVALGDGSGAAWQPWDDGLAASGEDYGMFATDFADVDADGDLDLGSSSFGCCSGVHVYLNHHDGTWSQSFGFLGGNSTNLFFFADFDGNGRPDLAGGNSLGNVFLGDGAGGFVAANGNLPTGSTVGMAAGDADGDGDDELGFVASGGAAQVWRWSSGNVWSPVGTGLPPTSHAQAVQLADMDADGSTDLVAFGKGRLSVWLGDGGASWSPVWSGITPGTGSKLARFLRVGGDLDHNGYPDVVAVEDVPTGLFQSENRPRLWREASRAEQLAVHVVEPRPARTWRGGQVRFVDWLASVPDAADARVRIELSSSGPGGPWTLIATSVPNGGRHQLVVPPGIDSSDCYVRVQVAAAGAHAQAVNPAPFRIAP